MFGWCVDQQFGVECGLVQFGMCELQIIVLFGYVIVEFVGEGEVDLEWCVVGFDQVDVGQFGFFVIIFGEVGYGQCVVGIDQV